MYQKDFKNARTIWASKHEQAIETQSSCLVFSYPISFLLISETRDHIKHTVRPDVHIGYSQYSLVITWCYCTLSRSHLSPILSINAGNARMRGIVGLTMFLSHSRFTSWCNL